MQNEYKKWNIQKNKIFYKKLEIMIQSQRVASLALTKYLAF